MPVTGGPYNAPVPPGSIASIPLDGDNSSCFDSPCTYKWTLQCPNATAKTYNEPNPVITAGPSPFESIDTTGLTTNKTCNLTLTVTDVRGVESSKSTPITIA